MTNREYVKLDEDRLFQSSPSVALVGLVDARASPDSHQLLQVPRQGRLVAGVLRGAERGGAAAEQARQDGVRVGQAGSRQRRRQRSTDAGVSVVRPVVSGASTTVAPAPNCAAASDERLGQFRLAVHVHCRPDDQQPRRNGVHHPGAFLLYLSQVSRYSRIAGFRVPCPSVALHDSCCLRSFKLLAVSFVFV